MAMFPTLGPRVHAQEDGASLTEEFRHMSAKERTRLAEREQEDASRDTVYQRIMADAEAAFQAGRYQEALEGYKLGRKRRPLNVYPKVKIEDIRELIAKRDAQAADSTSSQPRSVGVPELDEKAPAASRTDKVIEKASAPVPGSAGKPPVVRRARSIEETHDRAVDPAPVTGPDGMVEEQFRQGTALVVQRTVTLGGERHVYRKVVHNWGQTYYFLDGNATDARVWTERFGDN